MEVEEDSLETVTCQALFESMNKSRAQEFTLEWFDQNGNLVPNSQSDRDHQISYKGTSVEDGTAYLFASGRGKLL